MWAPFFELPKDIGCECTGSNAPAPADEEAPVRANDVPAPPTSDAKVQGSSSRSSAVTGAVTGAGSKPLRPGAVGIGSHAPELQVQGLRIRGGVGADTNWARQEGGFCHWQMPRISKSLSKSVGSGFPNGTRSTA